MIQRIYDSVFSWRLLKYLLRWQLSTPILWFVIYLIGPGIVPTIAANLVGGLIFYRVDQFIFRSKF